MPIRIFFWGAIESGYTSRSRRDALMTVGCDVTSASNLSILQDASRVSHRLARHFSAGPLVAKENRALLAAVDRDFDLLWIDKGRLLSPQTLGRLRSKVTRIVHFSPDPMFIKFHRTANFMRSIPSYDLHVTTKPEEVEQYLAHGARAVLTVGKSFNPAIHHPYPEEETKTFRSDLAFVGTWTRYKEQMLGMVIRAFPALSVRIWGPSWRNKAKDPVVRQSLDPDRETLLGQDYGRALSGARMALGLLSWDLAPEEVITDRIIEIPACGTLLVAPSTSETRRIFAEDEALLFESDQDLLDKLRWLLDHPEIIEQRARCGHARVMGGGFRDEDVVRRVLEVAIPGLWGA